jgi:Domain of unknown function (DUF4293)
MWQRIQTVFLGITILALLLSLVFPIWSAEINGEINVLTAFYYMKGDQYLYNPYSLTAILIIGSATLAIIEITKYKNRLTQMKIGALNSLFLVGAIGSATWFATQLIKTHQVGGQYGVGLWALAIPILCNLLANRFIRKDERLVRDADRLR